MLNSLPNTVLVKITLISIAGFMLSGGALIINHRYNGDDNPEIQRLKDENRHLNIRNQVLEKRACPEGMNKEDYQRFLRDKNVEIEPQKGMTTEELRKYRGK